MKSTRTHVFTLLGSAGVSFASCATYANPSGGSVVGGRATISTPNPTTLNIDQSSNTAAIDWRTFSISKGETVNFLQPSSNSSTLNRVLDAQTSVIDGALNANGQVYIYDASGVLFGKDAKVNVNGLLATTSNISTSDFMAGRLHFTGSSQPTASIDNEGAITVSDGGFAALVAPAVRNSGIISGRLGRIVLAAGETYTVDLYGDQLINFAVPTASAPTRSVTQSGTLIADGGRVLLTTDAAAGVVQGVINMSGTVRADSAAQLSSGAIVLSGANTSTTISGTLGARGIEAGRAGGSIDVLTSSVEVTSGGRIDASGSGGGGTVRLGGGFSTEANTRVADAVSINPGALIDVSGIGNASAGRISVWGRETLDVQGTLAARGGAQGGDGGYIEVSGGKGVRLEGDIQATAAKGHGGTLLLDPSDISITPLGGSSLTGATIAGIAIDTLLRQGVAVALVASNSITVNDVIDGRPPPGQTSTSPSGAFSLQAGSLMILQPIITNNSAVTLVSTTGDITFEARAYVVVANSDPTSSSGVGNAAITLKSAGDVSANQLVSLGTVTVTAAGNVQLAQALNGLKTGSAVVSGDFSLNAKGSVSVDGINAAGDISVTGGNGADLSSAVTSAGNLTVTTINSGAAITLAAGSGPTVATAAAAGDVNIEGAGAVTLNGGVLSTSGAVTVHADGDLTMNGAQGPGALELAGGGAVKNSSAPLISSNSSVSVLGATITLNAPADTSPSSAVALSAKEGVTLGSAATGSVSLNGQVISGDKISITAATLTAAAVGSDSNSAPIAVLNAQNDIALNGAGAYTIGGPVLSQAGSVTVNTQGNVSLNGVRSGGDFNVTTNGSIANSTTPIDAGGGISLQTPGGAVNLNASLIARDGSIRIGSTGTAGQQVGQITISPNSVLQSVDSAPGAVQSDGIAIYTADAITIPSLIAGSSGAVTVHSGGAVNLGALFGLLVTGGPSAPGVGTIDIMAGGPITMAGAVSSGDITISTTSGLVKNTGGSLSATGKLDISGNSIDIGAVTGSGGTSAASLLSTGDTTLTGVTGTVSIGGNISSGGAVTVTAPGALTLNGVSAVNLLSLTSSGDALQNESGSLISKSGGINLTGNSISTGILQSYAAVTLNAVGNVKVGEITSEVGDISVQNAGSFESTGAVQAGGSVNVQKTGSVTFDQSVRAGAGNITLGTDDTHRVGAVTIAGNSQAIAGGGNLGDLSIYSSGAVNAQGYLNAAGALTLHAGGLVNTNGANAGGIEINSGAALTNSTATLTSAQGVSLTGSSITLNGVTGAEAVHAANEVQLTASGDVTIQGEVESTGGNIDIGTTAPIHSLLTSITPTYSQYGANGPGGVISSPTLLAADSAHGSIDVEATGSITTTSLVAGTQGSIILSGGGDIAVRGTINSPTNAGANTGVGLVALIGTGDIEAHDINVAGGVASARTNGNSVYLTSGSSGGSVEILGPIQSGGNVYIGQTTPVTTPGDSHNSQINLSNNITTANGMNVELDGDVTLFKGITRWDIECAIGGGCSGAQTPVDGRLFHGNVGIATNSNDNPAGFEFAVVNDPGVLAGTFPNAFSGLAAACGNGCTYIAPSGMDPAEITVGAGVALGLSKLTLVALDSTGKPNQYNTNQSTIPPTAAYDQSQTPALLLYGCTGGVYVCGVNQTMLAQAGELPGSPQLLAAEADFAQRNATMQDLFGSLAATITASGGKVTIDGNLARERGSVVSTYNGTPLVSGVVPINTTGTDVNSNSPESLNGPDKGLGYIVPSFVSQQLNVQAGSGTIAIKGHIGDQLVNTGTVTNPIFDLPVVHTLDQNGVDTIEVGVSQLGAFGVALNASTVNLLEQPQPYTAGVLDGYRLTTFTINSVSAFDLAFGYFIGTTTPASGAFNPYSVLTSPGSPGGSLLASSPVTSPPQGGTAQPGSTTVGGIGLSGGNGATLASAGNNGVTLEGGQEGLVISGLPPPEVLTDVASTEESVQNSMQYDVVTARNGTEAAQEAENSCPRGAAQLADLGSKPLYGVAPNVFSRCHP